MRLKIAVSAVRIRPRAPFVLFILKTLGNRRKDGLPALVPPQSCYTAEQPKPLETLWLPRIGIAEAATSPEGLGWLATREKADQVPIAGWCDTPITRLVIHTALLDAQLN